MEGRYGKRKTLPHCFGRLRTRCCHSLLNDEKTKLMEEGKSADAVDDLLVKVGNAPLKKFKVIERKRSDEAR